MPVVGVDLRQQRRRRTLDQIQRAALELFAVRGYDAVTTADIAAAAGVGTRTLFRYVADKEDVLFADDPAFQARLADALAGRPRDETPGAALLAAAEVVCRELASRREELLRRRAIIDASPALLARERAKHAGYELVLADALAARRVPIARARLLGRVGVACFDEAVERWLGDRDPLRPGLVGRLRRVFGELPELLAR